MESTFDLDRETVAKDYKADKRLGSGSDGIVTRYVHKHDPKQLIAVKTPAERSERCRNALMLELQTMQILGNSAYTVELLGYDEHWQPLGPAIFYEFCNYGDATEYSLMVRTQYGFIPEETVWKLFADISQGLNFLHNSLPTIYVHGDLKNENILVSCPWANRNSLSILPNFKIADLSRAETYDPNIGKTTVFNGTYEYAPPLSERDSGATPAADVWCLGASLQKFALGIMPIEATDKFLRNWKQKHGRTRAPKREELEQEEWRKLIPVIQRPLNATVEAQVTKWDVPRANAMAYSDALNRWYMKCLDPDLDTRLSSRDLVEWLIPVAEHQIKVHQASRKLQDRKANVRNTYRVLNPLSKVNKKQGNRQFERRHSKTIRPAVRRSNAIAHKTKIVRPGAGTLNPEDFGLRLRKSSEIRKHVEGSEQSAKLRNIRNLQQKYMKGMKRKE